MKRYHTKQVESEYGMEMDAVLVHNHAREMGRIFAQIKAEEPKNLDLLEQLGKMILDLQLPDDIIER